MSNVDNKEKEKEPEILQQITNFFDSLSLSLSSLGSTPTPPPVVSTTTTSSTSTTTSSNLLPPSSAAAAAAASASGGGSHHGHLQKQLSFNKLNNASSISTHGNELQGGNLTQTPSTMVRLKSMSPTSSQSQFPAFYQYAQKTLKELDENRLLLIEHLKSVKFNLATQSASNSDDDPISVYKIRMELAKRKTSLESELKQLDEMLGTKSFVEEPIDGFTNFLNMIIPDSSTTPSSTPQMSGSGIGSSFTSTDTTYNIPHQQQRSNHHIPNSIIPTSTPLDNPDPNQPRFPPRENINAKLYVDCDDYFAASALAIENATREVFITAWFLSPEVYLIRYPVLDIKYRLDNLLQRKAKQGVKIFILLWDETKIATFKGSKRAKDKLEELHNNIKVIRHPPFTPIYWSHHQKTLIVDQEIAFVGGVDFCFGRYDNWCHHLIDVNSTLWPGKDYYNPCLGEMGDIFAPNEDSIDRKKIARMPWHDIMVGVNGLAARDVALNFVLRWNHHRDDYYPPLYFNTTPLISNGSSTCQLLRSMDEWSGGGRNERSIHTAYIQAIEDANHYIYIENQNFVSTHAPGVWNQISFEIVKRIKRAIRKREVFRVIIVLPSQQDGKFQEETHIRGLMHWQYLTLIRNENSIVKTLKREFPNEDLSEYIGFYSLRTHACLEGNYVTEQIYVHSKLMVIDDRVAIVGSANINDRSLNGERDSELAFIIRDEKDMIKTRMNGKEYMASRVIYNFRLRLWKEHIGLLPHIDHPPLQTPPASSQLNMQHKLNSIHQSGSFSSSSILSSISSSLSSSPSSSSYSSTVNPNVDTNLNINQNNNNNQNIQNNNNNNQNIISNQNTSSNSLPINSPPLTINSQYRIPKQSHHRSSSFQGPSSSNKTPISSLPSSPLDSPQHSPRKANINQATEQPPSQMSYSPSSSSDPPPSSLTLSSPISQMITKEKENRVGADKNEIFEVVNVSKNIIDPENVIIEDYNSDQKEITNQKEKEKEKEKDSLIKETSFIAPLPNPTTIPSSQPPQKVQHDQPPPTTTINKVVYVSEIDSPKLQPRSLSSLYSEAIESSVVGGIDLTDPIDSSFYIGVWIATAASNTRIYDTVFAAIPKNSIKTCDEFNQCLKKPVSIDDTRLLSEVRGNLIYHPLDFLADDNIQPSFLLTDDLFQ
ncbi:phospholipase D1 [Cavenderia fasciculata]|uniref:phospholipase D n=1 Tax=Cavenderia fasciculata TaxID=261658 RepID=F4Q5P8_CACFS|nr:phospholipase D1 [Cavenderia fasciculata]EGG17307.1 phospholipase D1 [Cavenderia fasciculata]|eukprot:XP_004355791.1 phospholipase D1 [Cavenderia fasciculata]